MGNTYPNHKGNYYYRNHTLYHIGTLDPLGVGQGKERRNYYASWGFRDRASFQYPNTRYLVSLIIGITWILSRAHHIGKFCEPKPQYLNCPKPRSEIPEDFRYSYRQAAGRSAQPSQTYSPLAVDRIDGIL